MASSSKPDSAPDGRLLRSERSREAIVQALFDLVGEGIIQPTAEQVAARAGVGIRTVFRHFSDVEGLFAAMAERLRAEVLPVLRAEPPVGDIEARARALVERRAAVYERIAPYKRSSNATRWRSDFLQKEHLLMVRELRRDLFEWLPELADGAQELAEALELVSSFEAWDRLRTEQRLGRSRAQEAMEHAVLALAGDLV